MEAVIDLAQYADILVRRWKMVILPAIVVALGVGFWTILLPTKHRATIWLVPVNLTSQVSYGTAIRTSSEDVSRITSDRDQRLASYLELVQSPNIAQAVIVALGDVLPREYRSVEVLLTFVSGETVAKSDLIEIRVDSADPQLAELIATHWATEYIHHVNSIYGEVAIDPYETIKSQKDDAKIAYEQAQAALEAILYEDPEGELKRQISEYGTVIDSIRLARSGSISALVEEMRRVDWLIASAQDMLVQSGNGKGDLPNTDGISLMMLRLQVLGSYRSTPNVIITSTQGVLVPEASYPYDIGIEIDDSTIADTDLDVDLGELVEALQRRRAILLSEWTIFSKAVNEDGAWGVAAVSSPMAADRPNISHTLGVLENRVRALETELSSVEARRVEIEASRDLAWETYENIARKEAELALAVATTGAELRMGTQTIVTTVPNDLLRRIAVAAAAALILGSLAAFGAEFWQQYKSRAKILGESSDPLDSGSF